MSAYFILEHPETFNWDMNPARTIYRWSDRFGKNYETRSKPLTVKDYERFGYKNLGRVVAESACAACSSGKHLVSKGRLYRALRFVGDTVDACTGKG